MWKRNPFARYDMEPPPTPPSLPTVPAEDIGNIPSDVWVIKTKK